MIMYLHLLVWFFLSLVTANLLAAALSSQVPVEILNGSSAAAIQSGGDIRIYYQAIDNSIHEWKSHAPNSLTYVDTFLVPGFSVKENSPLAAVWESSRSPGEHSFYYIAPDNYLRGYRSETAETNWSHSGLNNAKFTVKPGSRYLYAVAVPNGPVRVGYQCISGNICEASSRQDDDWHTREV